jgi:hypothetical protein
MQGHVQKFWHKCPNIIKSDAASSPRNAVEEIDFNAKGILWQITQVIQNGRRSKELVKG